MFISSEFDDSSLLPEGQNKPQSVLVFSTLTRMSNLLITQKNSNYVDQVNGWIDGWMMK